MPRRLRLTGPGYMRAWLFAPASPVAWFAFAVVRLRAPGPDSALPVAKSALPVARSALPVAWSALPARSARPAATVDRRERLLPPPLPRPPGLAMAPAAFPEAGAGASGGPLSIGWERWSCGVGIRQGKSSDRVSRESRTFRPTSRASSLIRWLACSPMRLTCRYRRRRGSPRGTASSGVWLCRAWGGVKPPGPAVVRAPWICGVGRGVPRAGQGRPVRDADRQGPPSRPRAAAAAPLR